MDAQLTEGPGDGTPSILGDMNVPTIDPFFTFLGLNTILLG